MSWGEWHWALPPAAQDALRAALGLPVRSARLQWLGSLVADLAREAPRWEQAAIDMLLQGEPADDPALRKALATALAARPLKRPDRLIEAIRRRTARPDDPDSPPCEHLLLALAGTDSVATLELWASAFRPLLERAAAEPEPGDGQRSVFLCFLKALQHRLLAYPDFAAAVVEGRVLTAIHDGGRRAAPAFYHPVLDYLGITRSDAFRLAYQRLACELTAPGRALAWREVSALRRYWSAEGFLQALAALKATPNDPVQLYLAKWTFGLEPGEAAGALSRSEPGALMLVSLLRTDLDRPIGEALQCPEHAARMRWLRLAPREAFYQAAGDEAIRDWCRRWGAAALSAVYALTQVSVPTPLSRATEVFDDALREQGDAQPVPSERAAAFVAEHLCSDLRHVIENVNLLEALVGGNDEEILSRAREGWISAVRALGLTHDHETERAETLLALRRSGSKPIAEAAEDALELLVSQHELANIEELERRLDLSASWTDAGLEGRPARVWWEVAGHRLKLSIVGGKAQVTAYGPKGPRKTLPQRVRRDPQYEEVVSARRELARQYARFRQRFEEAMVCRQAYSLREIEMLAANPVIASILSRLVVRCDDAWRWGGDVCGEEGLNARDWRRLWIAHPMDLLAYGTLRQWQDTATEREVAQPFRQCFREIYPLDPEEATQTACLRFAGHPVAARQAFALLRSRRYFPGSGEAHRNWPHAEVQARLVWAEGVENIARHLFGADAAPVVTGEIYFRPLSQRRGPGAPERTGASLPLGMVDPILCSETLRDADLVASSAAAGDAGFTSRETMVLRAALIRHLAKRLGLWHVAVSPDRTHTLIQGRRATYRVHLGSGSAFIEPEGRHLSTAHLVARGRPLPLEDTDSATYRILALVVALAQDDQIRNEAFLAEVGRL